VSSAVVVAGSPTWATKRFTGNPDGADVIDFARTFMHVTKGLRAGEPLVFTDWQQDLLHSLYERRVDGRRRHRRGLLGLPRKDGKSLIGSAIALHGLVEGGLGAEVYAAAGDRQQARIVFGEARLQVMRSSALSAICKVYRDVIEIPATGSIFRVLSSDAKLQQGLSPSTVVLDELHVQPNADLYDALTLGSGARVDPLTVAITTAGYDLESLCGKMYQYGKSVAAGDVVDDAFWFHWWEAAADCTLNDRDEWYRANPNLALGLIDIEDMETAAKQTSESAFRRYRLNQWTRSLESWLPVGAFEACRSAREVSFDLPIYVGIDMALKHDSIAVVVAQPQDGVLVVRAKIWHPQDAPLDVAAVEAHLRWLHRTYEVREFAYDPAYFQRSAEILADDGLPMVEFPQNAGRMIPACGNAFELIVNQRVAHDGSPMFVDQVLSAAQRMTDNGWRLSKGRSKRKIDAAIALVMALDRATLVLKSGDTPSIIDVWKD